MWRHHAERDDYYPARSPRDALGHQACRLRITAAPAGTTHTRHQKRARRRFFRGLKQEPQPESEGVFGFRVVVSFRGGNGRRAVRRVSGGCESPRHFAVYLHAGERRSQQDRAVRVVPAGVGDAGVGDRYATDFSSGIRSASKSARTAITGLPGGGRPIVKSVANPTGRPWSLTNVLTSRPAPVSRSFKNQDVLTSSPLGSGWACRCRRT